MALLGLLHSSFPSFLPPYFIITYESYLFEDNYVVYEHKRQVLLNFICVYLSFWWDGNRVWIEEEGYNY